MKFFNNNTLIRKAIIPDGYNGHTILVEFHFINDNYYCKWGNNCFYTCSNFYTTRGITVN